MQRKNNLLRSIVSFKGNLLIGTNLWNVVINFFIAVVAFNALTLSQFGSLSLLQATVAIFQTLFNSQSWQGLLRLRPNNFVKVKFSCYFIDTVFSLLGSIVMLLTLTIFEQLAMLNTESFYLPSLIILSILFLPNPTTIACIRRKALFNSQAFVDLIATTTKGVLIYTVWLTGHVELILFPFIIFDFVRYTGYVIVAKIITFKLPSWKLRLKPKRLLLRVYQFSAWGAFTDISHLPTAQFDKLIISALAGLEALAIWDIIKRLVLVMVQITTVINQLLYPYFIERCKNFSYALVLQQAKNFTGLLFLTLLFLYLPMVLSFDFWFYSTFHYEPAQYTINVKALFLAFCLTMSFILSAMPIHALFLATAGSMKSFYISIAGNTLFLVVTVISVSSLNLYGSVLAIFISDLFIILTKLVVLQKRTSA